MKGSRWMTVLAVALAAGAAKSFAAQAPQDSPTREGPVKPSGVKVSAGTDGFALQSESGDFRLQLRGLLQLDARFYASDDANLGTDTFLVRRARPIVTGSLGKYFEFNVTPDFGGGTAVILDACFDLKASPAFRVRFGKFKPPIGIEHLQSDTYLSFPERAYPASLVPNRDVGIQVSGDLAGGIVAYAVGAFDGTTDGANTDVDGNDGKDVVGRVVFSPFKKGGSALQSLAIGVGGSRGRQAGAASAYRTGGQLAFFGYVTGVTADGARTRVAPELSFFAGPFGLMAEYARSRTGLKKTATSARNTIDAEGWKVTASVFLTGDTAGFGGVKVKKPFDPARGQWGGLQLAARVNGFDADEAAFRLGLADPTRSARKARAWAVGLDWYLNGNLKQMLSYERTTFSGGAAGRSDRPAEDALFFRGQVSF